MSFFWWAYYFNMFSFLAYGMSCLVTPYMEKEFLRYRKPHLRVFAGVMQILAGLMLIVGLTRPLLFQMAALLIIIMMVYGILVRRSIGDSIVRMFPALFYFLLNGILLIIYLEHGEVYGLQATDYGLF